MSGRRECIRVVARVRPLGEGEQALGEAEALIAHDGHIKVCNEEATRSFLKSSSLRPSSSMRQFEFDGSFDPSASTHDVYESAVKDIVISAMGGFNSTILLYGQTGSGKTHTLTGFVSEHRSKSPLRRDGRSPIRRRQIRAETGAGLLQMAMREVFQESERLLLKGQKLFVSLSCLEVYNESVYDLLREDKTLEEPLIVSEDVSRAEFTVKGCRQEVVTSLTEAAALLRRGDANRRFAETTLNHHSSRGHMMFRLFFELVEDNGPICHSVCNFVDLAGSERVDRVESEDGSRLRAAEGKHINKSLFFLTQIIHQLSSLRVPAHVPYRNSSLTKLLKSSIGGNAHTLIILCLHPGPKNFEQSLGTLRFGTLARTIENVIERNIDFVQGEASIARLIAEFGDKITLMEKQLSQAGNKEPLIAHIRKLEEQQNFLQKQYDKLLLFHDKTPLKQLDHHRSNTLHLRSCGAVESYALHAPSAPPALFTAMSDRSLAADIFQRDIVSNLKTQLAHTQKSAQKAFQEIQSLDAKLSFMQKENLILHKLINIFLNTDQESHLRLGCEIQKTLVDNALAFIENCKIVEIHYALPPDVQLALKFQKSVPNLTLDILMRQLNTNARFSFAHDEVPSLSDRADLNDQGHSSFSSCLKNSTTLDGLSEKSSLISTSYLLYDTI